MTSEPSGPHGAYYTVKRDGRAEVREKGSVFVGLVEAVGSEVEARDRLELWAKEFSDASHHCFAWRLGGGQSEPTERCSDAGEPAGTAGQPILRVLRGREVSDALLVVIRWFGGTKLGKGGLARSYAAAAVAALENARLEIKVPRIELIVRMPYDRVGAVKKLIHPPEVELVKESYGDHAELVLSVSAPHQELAEQAVADLGLTISSTGSV